MNPNALTKLPKHYENFTTATTAGKGRSSRYVGSSETKRAKWRCECHASLKPSLEIGSAQFDGGGVLPKQDCVKRKKHDVNEMANLLKVSTVTTSADKAHQACNIIDEPETSAEPERTRSVDESVSNHEHLQLGYLLGARGKP